MSSFLRAFLTLNAGVAKALLNANKDAVITTDRVLQESFIDQVLTARRERREQRANEMANQLATKEAEKRRKDILVSFQKNKLERILKASDFIRGISEDDPDIEDGTNRFDTKGVEDVEKDEALFLSDTTSHTPQTTPSTATGASLIPAAGMISSDIEEVDIDGKMDAKVLLPQGDEKPPLATNITCAICLDQYEEGETVVWSGNPLCKHAFHQQCILDYLVHENQEAAPCPCCRQIFLPMK